MRNLAISTISVLLVLSLVQLASAAPFQGHLQPEKDTRCLTRVTGGFSLETCASGNRLSFQNPGSIGFGDECVFVQIPAQKSDPWKSGSRLMARRCDDSTIPASHKTWTYDSASQQIRAASPPSSSVPKCLSIEGLTGNLRAVVKNCNEFGVTKWTLSP